MSIFLAISRVIDAVNVRLGRILAWAILLAVTVSAVNAVIRKIFDMSSNAWLELQWVLFGVVFLLCAPWTLRDNEHIRIDIVTSYFKKRTRDWIDVFGHLFFLIPLAIIMVVTAIPFAERSYSIDEQSVNAGGLPQWPAKLLVPIGFVLLLLQGISELIKRIAVIRGDIDDPHIRRLSAAEIEAERLLQLAESQGDAKPLR